MQQSTASSSSILEQHFREVSSIFNSGVSARLAGLMKRWPSGLLGPLGASWEPLRDLWGPVGASVGLVEDHLGTSWGLIPAQQPL